MAETKVRAEHLLPVVLHTRPAIARLGLVILSVPSFPAKQDELIAQNHTKGKGATRGITQSTSETATGSVLTLTAVAETFGARRRMSDRAHPPRSRARPSTSSYAGLTDEVRVLP